MRSMKKLITVMIVSALAFGVIACGKAEHPRSDAQTTTKAGDIVLYSGNQMVVFYGPNSWAYTRLGHISDKNEEELAQLLGNGDVTITIERTVEK